MSLPPKESASNKVCDVKMTVGAEAANVINVACVAEWMNNEPADRRVALPWYLSTDPEGDNIAATAPTGGVAIGTDGVLIESIADKHGLAVTSVAGKLDVNITDVGTPTFYLVVVLPSGDLVVSSAITFA